MPRALRYRIVTFLFVCSSQFAAQATQPSGANFPLSKGAYWVYRGTIQGRGTRVSCDKAPWVSTNVTWRMEVVDVFDRDRFSGAVISGYLFDLMSPEIIANGRVNPKPEQSLLIREGDRYYVLQDDAMQTAVRKMKDPSASLQGLIQDHGPDFDLPLSAGKVFGDAPQMAMQKTEIESRHTEGVGWVNVVEKVATVSLDGVKGVTSARSVTRYQLRYLTNSSLRTMGFVHGIGITDFAFDYHPAGCQVLNTNLKLTEYHRGS